VDAAKVSAEELLRVIKDHPEIFKSGVNKKVKEEGWRKVCYSVFKGYTALLPAQQAQLGKFQLTMNILFINCRVFLL